MMERPDILRPPKWKELQLRIAAEELNMNKARIEQLWLKVNGKIT